MARTRVDSVEVVQVRREAESLDRALNVRLDMRRRVRNGAGAEAVESTLRCDYSGLSSVCT